MGVKKNKLKGKGSSFNQIGVKECSDSPLSKIEPRKQNKRTFKHNEVNVKDIRKRLSETYASISKTFDILNLNRDSFLSGGNTNLMKNTSKDGTVVPAGVNNHLISTGKSDEKAVKIKMVSANGNITKISWPRTLEGLVEARKLFKGKRLSYNEKLLKKNLKNRVTKKRKQLEFNMKLGGKKGKKEGLIKEELLKNKKIKPVYNSEGKVIHSKYDFSEIGAKKIIISDFCQKLIKDSNKIGSNSSVSEHEPKNSKSIGANSKSDTELLSKHSMDSTKKKETGKINKKNKWIENVTLTFTKENEQEPVRKKSKLIDEKSDRTHNENESESKTVINTKFKPVFNKDNKMVFSKIDFSDTSINKRMNRNGYRDPKKMLRKLEMNKAKIDELKSTNTEKATELVEKEKWITALKRASGEKIKDDPQLLKKTVMKEKRRKKESRKKWEARVDAVEKKKQEKQKKRMENIMAKKKEKKKKKQKKAIKKGHYVVV